MLNLQGLTSVTQLSKGDKVLVKTSKGLAELDAEVLGEVLSNTSLFETYKRVELSELNVKNITTHNKIQKYLDNDTSDEIYMEYSDNTLNFIRGQVLANSDNEPLTTQAQAITGEPLYWSHDLSEAEFFDGFPWKTKYDDKIFITTEKTGYPVNIYQYQLTYLKQCDIQIVDNEPIITDTYTSKGSMSKGIVKKQGNEFLFVLQERNKDWCGIKISVNDDDSVTGKLLGTWEGLNDWDVDSALTMKNFKNWFYHNQDYYTYIKPLSVDTSNKIGWYLNKETEILHVYTRLENGEFVVILAKNKTNSAGSFIQEQAVNLLGEKLYWEQDMAFQSGISGNGIPLRNGRYVFMTTEETDYPVYIYQYDEVELFRIDYASLADGSNGVKQTFSDNSNISATLSKTNTEFHLELVDTSKNTVLSSVKLNKTGGKLDGKWYVEDVEIGVKELPEQSESTKDRVLKSDGAKCSWQLETKELPTQSSTTNGKVLKSDGKTCSWQDETVEVPKPPEDDKTYILSVTNGEMSWVDLETLLG